MSGTGTMRASFTPITDSLRVMLDTSHAQRDLTALYRSLYVGRRVPVHACAYCGRSYSLSDSCAGCGAPRLVTA